MMKRISIIAVALLAFLPAVVNAAAPPSVCGVRDNERSTTVEAKIPPSQAGNVFSALRTFAQQYGYRYADSGGANQSSTSYWILSLDKSEYKDKLFLHISNDAGSDTYKLTAGWCEGNADWKQHWERFLKFIADIPSK